MKLKMELEIVEDEQEVIQSFYEWYMSHSCAMGAMQVIDSKGNTIDLSNCMYAWKDKLQNQILNQDRITLEDYYRQRIVRE